jgi:hypothetical protein
MGEELTIDRELQIAELEERLDEAYKKVKLGNDLKELKKDPRFQSVIIDGYIGELAEFLFNELTKSITLQSQPEEQLREGLLAIRHLKSYIGFDGLPGDVEYNAELAKSNAEEIQATLDKL